MKTEILEFTSSGLRIVEKRKSKGIENLIINSVMKRGRMVGGIATAHRNCLMKIVGQKHYTIIVNLFQSLSYEDLGKMEKESRCKILIKNGLNGLIIHFYPRDNPSERYILKGE